MYINNLSPTPPSLIQVLGRKHSDLVAVMACRPFGTKPSPEAIMIHCELEA